MTRRLLLSAACIVIMPMWFSLQKSERTTLATAFSPVALAGHSTASGESCTCGCPGCICDPGETPLSCHNTNSVQKPAPVSDANSKAGKHHGDSSGIDFGSGALLFVIAFMLWNRFRA